MNITLEKPSIQWKDSYLLLVNEFKQNQEPFIPWVIGFDVSDFQAFLKILDDGEKGIGLAERHVPHATYWLIANDEVVGVSNLRLELTDKLRRDGGHIGYGVKPSARRRGYATAMLSMTLDKAKEFGIDECLVMCDKVNTASARTIIKNGGKYQDEEFLEELNEVVQRYWIET